MKKLFKIFLFIVIFNVLAGICVTAYITISTFGPAIKMADISITDLVKLRIEPDKKAELEKYVAEISSDLGKKAAEEIMAGISKIIPSTDISTMQPQSDYPYPPLDKVIEQNDKIASDAAAAGLKILEDAEKSYDIAKKKALEELEK